MTEFEGAKRGLDIDTAFRGTTYADYLRDHPRWSRYMPDGVSNEQWRKVLHADSDGLDQARLMIKLTERFLDLDTDNSTQLSEEEKELLFVAMATQNWGKSFDDDLSNGGDISYEFITPQDVEYRQRKFHRVYEEMIPDGNVKERYIVEKAIYDKTTKLGMVFDAMRRLNCLRTGLIAYRAYRDDPEAPEHAHLGALAAGVISNQLIPLVTYAEQFTPVKTALGGANDVIKEIFDNTSLLYSNFINQQTHDAFERAEIIWNRSHGDTRQTLLRPNGRKESILTQHSNFEKRFIRDRVKLAETVSSLRQLGASIVLTSGSFDLIHVGHTTYLEKAAEFGDFLVVGVDSDEKIKKRKGPSRPIVGEDERLRTLAHVRGVGILTLKDNDEEKWGLIKLIKPDVLVVTAETYTTEEIKELEEKYCGRVIVLEPQATTSTSARIRSLELKAQEQSNNSVEQALGSRVLSLLQGDIEPLNFVAQIKGYLGTL